MKLFNGYETGLRVAVSRQNIDLGRTCFDRIYREKGPAFVAYELFNLVLEQKYYLIGEISEQRFSLDQNPLWKTARKIILMPVNKDVLGLHSLVLGGYSGYTGQKDPKAKEMLAAHKIVHAPIDKAVKMVRKAVAQKQFGNYERFAVDELLKMAGATGLNKTRQMCLLAVILIAGRGLLQTKIAQAVSKLPKTKGTTTVVPWWAFTPESEIGRIALQAFEMIKPKEVKNLSTDDLKLLWRMYGVEATTSQADSGDAPQWATMSWWPRYVELFGRVQTLSATNSKRLWIKHVRPGIGGVVEKLIIE